MNETGTGIGHLELDSTIVMGENLPTQSVLDERCEEQGTAMPGGSATTQGILTGLTETSIKVFQINAARSKLVMHQLDRLLESKAADICLIQEPATDGRGVYLLDRLPYKVIANGSAPKAAIVIANLAINDLGLRQLSTPHNAVAAITVGDTRVTVISSYFQFSEPTQTSIAALESILDDVTGGVLVCGDVNARSTVWQDRVTDDRGKTLENSISENDMTVHNEQGHPPTFRNRG